MVGHLLWVSWDEVLSYVIIYFVLGCLYFLIHRRLLQLSQAHRSEKNNKTFVMFWDFIFYALMGVLVTFAVRVAGVLLVFGILIVPAVIGFLLGRTFIVRLSIGWTTGVFVSLIGSYLSYTLDFPTGGMVVVTLGLSLLIVGLIKGFQLSFNRG